jgi:hypothetical protein
MLTLKRADLHDHDVIVIGPPFEALSNLARDITQPSANIPRDAGLDFVVERPVPLADAAAQPAADTIHVDAGATIAPPQEHSRLGRSVKRAVIGFMIMLIGTVSTLVWRAHGDETTQIVARWTRHVALPAWLSARIHDVLDPSSPRATGSTEVTAQALQSPPAQVAAQDPIPQPATLSAQPTADASVTAPSATRLEAMARDLASAQQAIEQLKSNQDQMARELAKLRDQDARRRALALAAPPRPAPPPAGKPSPALPTPRAAAVQPRAAVTAPTPVPAQSPSAPRPPSPLP